eukprot:CAMPEP_0195526800 /NCGR_PEP_ID=MMETSP0794_2-20130614/28102_1 /TAXON_ID=515487 /ORGANISM="Stephanopyxis turris, Strain CCMP 815" /LENGTH=186 /DNA_ID=CAMNT_0040657579 /DNA_START=63 /DNA_END=623 /DNA_ORIENTATION=-
MAPPSEENPSSGPINDDDSTGGEEKSALQDNIDSKGKNAYYFAHAHKATGPKWDGKIEPKLLARTSESNTSKGKAVRSLSSFDTSSNIRSYSFSDEDSKVKIYVELPGIAEKCPNDEDVILDFTSQSFSLTLLNYGDDDLDMCQRRLAFSKLHGSIENASFKKKKDRIILTLNKSDIKEWSSIGSK